MAARGDLGHFDGLERDGAVPAADAETSRIIQREIGIRVQLGIIPCLGMTLFRRHFTWPARPPDRTNVKRVRRRGGNRAPRSRWRKFLRFLGILSIRR